jgi:hypothetical protein
MRQHTSVHSYKAVVVFGGQCHSFFPYYSMLINMIKADSTIPASHTELALEWGTHFCSKTEENY